MRCLEDLCLLAYLGNPAIVIRPYIDFEPWREYRVFVKENKCIGISQYYYQSNFPELTLKTAKTHQHQIQSFIHDTVIPNMIINTYIADIILMPEGLVILEANPFGLSDPCLFQSYDQINNTFMFINDGAIVEFNLH